MFTAEQQQAVTAYLHHCRDSGWRGLIHLADDETTVKSRCAQLLQQLAPLQAVLINNDIHQWQQQLGSECRLLVLDAFAGLNPNALGAVSACLEAGGILIVLSPPLAQWPLYADPDYRRMLTDDNDAVLAGHFLQRCVHYLAQAPHGLLLSADQCSVPVWPDKVVESKDFSGQLQAIEAIKKVATGRAGRPLVLSADRGRGKSAALGMACAQLMQQRDIRIVVCAISNYSVATLFRHIANQLDFLHGSTQYRIGNSDVRFYTPDSLLAEQPDADLLLIDEAAALPVSLLLSCTQRYKRIIFSTTLQGYEGNGRGFELRFLPLLQQQFPQCRRCYLQQPVRWHKDDPLEQVINELLLLNAVPEITDNLSGDVIFQQVSAQHLAQNEPLLRQLFALLVQAHYQTSPDDLRLLLDHPQLRIFIAMQGNVLLAAAMLMREGNVSAVWQQRLQQGRRCRGHLLPQALLGDGFNEMPEKTVWRVLRIAVQPALQRKGVGKQLLDFVQQQLSGDFIGASFSAESAVIRFWQSTGFQICRLGSHKESATGQYAMIVLRAYHADAQNLLARIREQFTRRLASQLLTLNQDMACDAVMALPYQLGFVAQAQDIAQCIAYSKAQRGFEQVFFALQQVLLAQLAAGISIDDMPLLVDKVLLNRHWQTVADRYKLSGRHAVEQRMRGALQLLLASES